MLWFVLEQCGELDELHRIFGNTVSSGCYAAIVRCCMCTKGREMNINDYVSVVLSKYGADVYSQWASQFPDICRPVEKFEGDTLRDSLWCVMQIFGGDNIGMGMRSPFKECQIITDVSEIITKELT